MLDTDIENLKTSIEIVILEEVRAESPFDIQDRRELIERLKDDIDLFFD